MCPKCVQNVCTAKQHKVCFYVKKKVKIIIFMIFQNAMTRSMGMFTSQINTREEPVMGYQTTDPDFESPTLEVIATFHLLNCLLLPSPKSFSEGRIQYWSYLGHFETR